MGVSLDTSSLLNSDQGNSIGALLSLLTGQPIPPVSVASNVGTNLPPAHAAPLPQMNATTATSLLGNAPGAQPPGMVHRIASNLLGIPKAIYNHAGPGLPAEYRPYIDAGIITPEEAKAAKPQFLDNIFGPPDQYQKHLDALLAAHKNIQTIAENQRILNLRRSIESAYPLPPNPTQEQIRNNLAQRYDAYIGGGDTEMAKELGASLRGVLTAPRDVSALHEVPGVGLVDMTDPMRPRVAVPVGKADEKPQLVNAQEGIFRLEPDGLHDVATGAKYTGKTVHPTTMLPNFTPITISGGSPDAAPVVVPFNTKAGTAGAPIGEAKPATTRIENAQSAAAEARLTAAVSEMNNADPAMAEYEKKLATGTANISGLSQFAGSMANTFTHDDPASKVAQSAALAMLNRSNPELARYIRRGLSFAEAESMVSQRPSDFRTRMAAFLSSAASGASPEMIADIQSRRQAILTPLNRVVSRYNPSPASATTGPAASPSPLRDKYDAAQKHLRSQGKTDAEIKRIIGERP